MIYLSERITPIISSVTVRESAPEKRLEPASEMNLFGVLSEAKNTMLWHGIFASDTPQKYNVEAGS